MNDIEQKIEEIINRTASIGMMYMQGVCSEEELKFIKVERRDSLLSLIHDYCNWVIGEMDSINLDDEASANKLREFIIREHLRVEQRERNKIGETNG